MAKIKIHIDSQDPSPETIRKYKNFNKVEGKLAPFYTIQGMRKIFKRNKFLFVLLFLLWVLFLLFVLDELS